ncbi:dTDP-4-dehydrorhamnose reductase [Phorcysia thermohydrogeniphila]|uniref:dTDP-4-dehydrorhamnose reductase n=2 Tax=Phorcysia thermohydrogeniphila TaxID=936138 RepID=A0A4R1GJL8_9BACT|nr:dTDP-4-dehydrorhamnose reductase [Phorcysia thermohydrogeniphila]
MRKMRYLVIGKNGQLGKEFLRKLSEKVNVEVIAVGREECDISNLEQVLSLFSTTKPDVAINCAAYNFVDKAEEDYVTAIKVNSLGIRNLAFASKKYKSFLVHYSTDYVFDGMKRNGLYTEEDTPNPLNEYGKSKLLGEKLLKEETDNFLLFRVSWVYGDGKQNFIYKLLTWAKDREYLMISNNEVSVPTSTKTIVEMTLKALDADLKGLYHLTNSGYASRYEWAKKVLQVKGIRKVIYPVSSEVFNLPAKRPEFSAMSNSKLAKTLDVEIPWWEYELERFLKTER